MMPGGPTTRIESKENRKRTTTTKKNTSNRSNLVEKLQILSLGTKAFVCFYGCAFLKSGFIGFSFVQE